MYRKKKVPFLRTLPQPLFSKCFGTMKEHKKRRIMEKQKLIKVSSSGRQIKPPKKILPTSFGEEPPKKRTKSTRLLDKSLQILRARLKGLQNKRLNNQDNSLVEITTSKNTKVDYQKIILQNNP